MPIREPTISVSTKSRVVVMSIRVLKLLFRSVVLSAFIALIFSCEDSGQDFNGDSKERPQKKPNDASSADSTNGDENELASIPENITGTFLTKIYTEKSPSESDPSAVQGVSLEGSDGKTVRDRQVEVHVSDLSRFGVRTSIKPSTDARYHAYVTYTGQTAADVNQALDVAVVSAVTEIEGRSQKVVADSADASSEPKSQTPTGGSEVNEDVLGESPVERSEGGSETNPVLPPPDSDSLNNPTSEI